jgi:hypothetical protein
MFPLPIASKPAVSDRVPVLRDIVSVEISPAGAEPYGACADITVQGFISGKTIDFGSGHGSQLSYTNIANATIVFTVVSEGYDSSGNLGTITRTVYGTSIVRQPYPSHASNQDVTTTIRIALSDFIYNDDKNGGAGTSGVDPIVAIKFGAIKNEAAGDEISNPVTNFRCINSSTLDYAKVVGNWAWPGYSTVSSTVDLEFVAFHRAAKDGKPVACVRFDVTDQSTNTASQTVTAMSVSNKLTAANDVGFYSSSISTTTLDQGEVLTARARAYPWVGDSDSVLDTGDAVNTMPTPLYAPQYYRNDKSAAWGGFACCDDISGVNATGVVYSSKAAAEAGMAYKGISSALTALQSYNNTNYGHNDAGGGTIVLKAGTHTLNSTNGGTMTEWVTVMPMEGETKENVIVQPGAANAVLPGKLKLSGVTFGGNANYFRGLNTSLLWLHDCAINTSGVLTLYETPASYATANTGTMANGFSLWSTTNTSWSIVRGNNMSVQYFATNWVILGNNSVVPTSSVNIPTRDNSVFAYNTVFARNGTVHTDLNNLTISHGIAVVGNIFESLSASQPAMQIAADSSDTNAHNVIIWHNTIAGQRYNAGYNDSGSTARLRRNWSQKYNSFRDWNNKDDTFTTANAARTGSWTVGYGVGFQSNNYETSTFPGEYPGFDVTIGVPGYVADNSYTGAGTGNGNYAPDTSSALKGRIPTGQRVITCDLYGNNIVENGDIGAIQVTV